MILTEAERLEMLEGWKDPIIPIDSPFKCVIVEKWPHGNFYSLVHKRTGTVIFPAVHKSEFERIFKLCEQVYKLDRN